VIAAAPNITPPVRSKAEGICSKASSGDLAGARKAAREVCAEIVDAQPVSAVIKRQAKARCEKI
jgi:hypothetical protein